MSSIALRTARLTDHAVCFAAGVRDSLRTTQYYMRDMSHADDVNKGNEATFPSRLVGALARRADDLLSWAANLSVRLFLPQWRNLPSPFAPHMVEAVTQAIGENRLAMTSLFTAYFFRASRHILGHCAAEPHLVLEHRIDAARRQLAAQPPVATDRLTALGQMLLVLAETRAIARMGQPFANHAYLNSENVNLAVMATACLALLLAEEGKPIESLDMDSFFAIAGALLAPRLDAMEAAVAARDASALSRELAQIRALY
jgi:hypothetical protein